MCVLLLLYLTVRSLVFAPTPARVSLAGASMGTTWAAVLNAPDLDRAGRSAAQVAVQSALDRVDTTMSTWDVDSEVSRFNREQGTQPFAVSAHTFEVLRLAQAVSEQTGGAFDVTVRPLVAAWGFGADARTADNPPPPDELAAIQERVGFEHIVLLPGSEPRIQKALPTVEIDLSAVAKGYGADLAAQALRDLGHSDFMVEVGGEIYVSGSRPDGEPWRLAIERPEPGTRTIHAVIELSNRALATSGDYRSFREAGGRRVSHLIDPRSGVPVAHGTASVSVVADTTAVADAWATALSVLDADAGHALAEARGLAAYWIVRAPDGTYEASATSHFPAVEGAQDRTVP